MTLRQLLWMAEAKARDAWNHTSAVVAMVANAHRDPKKGRAFKPSDFDPYGRERGEMIEVNRENIGDLKVMFEQISTLSSSGAMR